MTKQMQMPFWTQNVAGFYFCLGTQSDDRRCVCVMTYDYMTFTRSDIKTNICSLNILNIDLRGRGSNSDCEMLWTMTKWNQCPHQDKSHETRLKSVVSLEPLSLLFPLQCFTSYVLFESKFQAKCFSLPVCFLTGSEIPVNNKCPNTSVTCGTKCMVENKSVEKDFRPVWRFQLSR